MILFFPSSHRRRPYLHCFLAFLLGFFFHAFGKRYVLPDIFSSWPQGRLGNLDNGLRVHSAASKSLKTHHDSSLIFGDP